MAYRRRPVRRSSSRRQFVWHRQVGSLNMAGGGAESPFGLDLLAGYRNLPGTAQTGATIMRVRGIIRPDNVAPETGALNGTFGLLVDSQNSDPLAFTNSPEQRPHEDWLGWLPWQIGLNSVEQPASWNQNASTWAVDIKSNRKVAEIGESLWLWTTSFPSAVSVYYNLSIGLKVA